MRYVDQIAPQAPQDHAKFEIAAWRGVGCGKGNSVKTGSEWPDFPGFLRRSDQVVLVLAIQAAEGANNVPNVSSDTEVRNPPHINRDFHARDLTTSDGGVHRTLLAVQGYSEEGTQPSGKPAETQIPRV